ncbi:nucleotidyltransferase family protein [Aureimonas populi]|uniref:NTP transferase domain-containing protein n=1 Tax=Aureimonas populi TaxID=1701758 RepID=A0ABW5CMQ8_9HYPH|nr:nucleotidyltransferase family protein [Aureimonas populi]
MNRVHALVLAAGQSRRMGKPNKLLARFGGVPLVRRSVETALASSADRVHVVLGHEAAEVEAALRGLDIRAIRNPAYGEGLATSLKAGFGAASEGAQGVLVMLADQPGLTPDHLLRLILAFGAQGPGAIVIAAHEGRRGNPVILPSRLGAEISELSGDVGARSIIAAHADLITTVEIGPAALLDVDTPEAVLAAGGAIPVTRM